MRQSLIWAPAAAFAAFLGGCSSNDTTGERVGTSSEALDYCAATVEGTDFVGSELSPVDWNAYHGSGRDFAFMKITQNTWIVGSAATFAANWSGAKQNSVYRIAYHFFDATADGNAQADAFVSAVKNNGGIGPDDMFMLDTECPCDPNQSIAQGPTDGCHNCLGYDLGGGNGSGWAPPDVIRQRILDMANAVQSMTGKPPIIYSYGYWLTSVAQITSADPAFGAFPLDIANISTNCTNLGGSVPAPWTRAWFWQYSWSGSVPGIPGPVDLDRFLGSATDLMNFAAPPCGTPVDQACTTSSQCCSGLSCKNWSYSGKPPYSTFCCGDVGASCSVGTDCCGGSACDATSHKCVCVPAGQWCINADECCAGYTCDLTTDKCVPGSPPPPDAGADAHVDSGAPRDSGAGDAGALEGGPTPPPPPSDAGSDAAGSAPGSDHGCACTVSHRNGGLGGTAVLLSLGALLTRRRRPRRSRIASFRARSCHAPRPDRR